MKRYKVPEDMLRAGLNGLVGKQSCRSTEESGRDFLEGVIGWLDETLHEGNAEFHRAIQKRAGERYPYDSTSQTIFEFGVSFARHYIRDLFLAPEPEPNFDEVWNALTVEINRVGMRKATEILRSQAGEK